jgi:transcriptional regulator with XRE-family HTH domain
MSRIILDKSIKRERLKRGWTQKELAKRSGVPFRTLLKVELGISKEPTIHTIYKIACAFNMTVNQLIEKKEHKKTKR